MPLNAKYGEIEGLTIELEGFKALIGQLRAAGDDLSDLSELNHRLGLIVIANTNAPRKSGELAGTLRAGKGKTKAVIRAGYAKRGAYAGVVHYGDPHRNHRANPFLVRGLAASQGQVMTELTNGINQILVKNNLN